MIKGVKMEYDLCFPKGQRFMIIDIKEQMIILLPVDDDYEA